jgi:hypothetical protein
LPVAPASRHPWPAALLLAAILGGCFGQSEQVHGVSGGAGKAPDEPEPPGEEEQLPPFAPAPLSMRKLLGWQYAASVRDLLGTEAANALTLPPDTAVNGFDAVGAAQLTVSAQAIDLYERSAHQAVKVALQSPARRAELVPCSPADPADAACMAEVVTRFGYRAFRRPMTDEEIATWVQVGLTAGTAFEDFHLGAGFALAGMLQSPHFLYLVEVGEPDPADPSRLRLTGYELATRLSYFLTGTLPDEALLAAAELGALESADGIRHEASRLLQRPEARHALDRFFDEALELREVPHLVKDPATFPAFNPALAASMREETRRVLTHVVWDEPQDFRNVFDAPWTFVNAELAQHYALDTVPASGFAQITLPASSRRGGILGHAGFLSLMAHPRETSPTLRGKFVRERLLCKSIPAPPDDVDLTLKEPEHGGPQTMREKLAVHRENASCSGCHALMDDIGLGLENFDALGRYRDTEHGLPIDPYSAFDTLGNFAGPRELGALLRQDPRMTACLVRNVFRMGVGHVDLEGEQAPLRMAEKAFEASGFRMQALLVELAASDAFRYAAVLEVTP